MPDEAACSVLSPQFLALWGSDTPGASALLSLCVEAAAVYIVRWPSEIETAAEACALLAALARLRAPRRGPAQMLAALPAWQGLARCDPTSLRGSSQRMLLEALCRAAAAQPESASRDTALRALITPLPQRLAAVAARCSAAEGGGSDALDRTRKYSSLLRPDVCVEVRSCCGALSGAALACGRDTTAITAECVGSCLPTLLSMLPSYCPSAEPLLGILKVHRDLARTAATDLPGPIAVALATHSADLIALYAHHAPPPPPTAAPATAAEEAEEFARYKQVKALLKLLNHLASRDEDGGADPAAEQQYTAALCAALGHVLPCVTAALLEFPKLCGCYLQLLGSFLENRPLAAVSMPPPLYASVLSSLCFGLTHHDASMCRSSLESAYEFARRAAQHPGQASATDDLLRQLLGRIAADLLTSRLHPDVVDPAAGNALLALIVAQPAHWQSLAGSLVSAQTTPETRDRMAAAFGALLSTNGVAANLSRPNRTRFRANLETLLQVVSSGGFVLPAVS
jgi:hypothetical protein